MDNSSQKDGGIWDQLHSRLTAMQAASQTRQTQVAALADKLSKRAQAYRERNSAPVQQGPVVPVLFFSTRQGKYGLPLESVVEIQSLESFSPVPRGPAFLHGVVHFRGSILALFDLSRLFGTREEGIADVHYYIVARSNGQEIAVAAGVVEDLRPIPASQIHSAVSLAGGTPPQWLRGIFEKDRLILDLDSILKDERVMNWRGGTPAG